MLWQNAKHGGEVPDVSEVCADWYKPHISKCHLCLTVSMMNRSMQRMSEWEACAHFFMNPNQWVHTVRHLYEIQRLNHEKKIRNGTFKLGLWCNMKKNSSLGISFKVLISLWTKFNSFWLVCLFVSGVKRDWLRLLLCHQTGLKPKIDSHILLKRDRRTNSKHR